MAFFLLINVKMPTIGVFSKESLRFDVVKNSSHQTAEMRKSESLLFAYVLTLKAPVTTAADNVHKYFFIFF